MRSSFNKIDGFVRVRGVEIRHLVLFDYGWFDKIYARTKYLISEKNRIIGNINHNFGKIRTDSHNSFPIDQILTFHNVIILFKSIVNKNKNEYYYNIFLEKGLYKGKSDTHE